MTPFMFWVYLGIYTFCGIFFGGGFLSVYKNRTYDKRVVLVLLACGPFWWVVGLVGLFLIAPFYAWGIQFAKKGLKLKDDGTINDGGVEKKGI